MTHTPTPPDHATVLRHAQELRAAYLRRLVARGGQRVATALAHARRGTDPHPSGSKSPSAS